MYGTPRKRMAVSTMLSPSGWREAVQAAKSATSALDTQPVLPDGSIPQVELSSCGLNGGPLKAEGSFSAGIACNLYGKQRPTYSHPMAMGNRHPYITQDGPDWSPEDSGNPPRQYIANGRDGLVAGFKYFDLRGAHRITVRTRGTARGRLLIRTDPLGGNIAEIAMRPAKDWEAHSADLPDDLGIQPLYLCYEGRGKLEILDISF